MTLVNCLRVLIQKMNSFTKILKTTGHHNVNFKVEANICYIKALVINMNVSMIVKPKW